MPGRDARSLVDHSRTVLSEHSEDQVVRFLAGGAGGPHALGNAGIIAVPACPADPAFSMRALPRLTAAAPAPPAPDRAGAPAADDSPDPDAVSATELEALLTAKTTQIDEGAQR